MKSHATSYQSVLKAAGKKLSAHSFLGKVCWGVRICPLAAAADFVSALATGWGQGAKMSAATR